MIYLDNSATTYPKPVAVRRAISNALVFCGANPGRSGHKMSLEAAEQIYECRKSAAKLFNVEQIENIVFVRNCTEAINVVLKGLLKPGDHVVVSCLEHNAIMRPLKHLSSKGITYTKAYVYENDFAKTMDSFREAITENTKLLAVVGASNVWGIRLPIGELAELAHENGAEILVDAAQSAGVTPIDFSRHKLDYLCVSGHKGLYGPMGTGILITCKGEKLDTFIDGGTGSDSSSLTQPSDMPDRFESGTPNTAGIAGLKAGIDFVLSVGTQSIHNKEISLLGRAYEGLSDIRGVKLYTECPFSKGYAPVLSFNIKDIASENVAMQLNDMDVAVRAGLHCSPLAHEYKGTLKTGAVRISPSFFSRTYEMDEFIRCVKKIAKK